MAGAVHVMRFKGMGAFVDHLARLPVVIGVAEKGGLGEAAALLRDRAKATLGTYQADAGPFEAWRKLAPSTQAERSLQGYTPDDPLLRSGALRDSIQSEVTDDPLGRVFTDNEHAAEMEFGTVRSPPRSFMGATAFVHGEEAAAKVGTAVTGAFAGKPIVTKAEP